MFKKDYKFLSVLLLGTVFLNVSHVYSTGNNEETVACMSYDATLYPNLTPGDEDFLNTFFAKFNPEEDMYTENAHLKIMQTNRSILVEFIKGSQNKNLLYSLLMGYVDRQVEQFDRCRDGKVYCPEKQRKLRNRSPEW